MEKVKDTIDTKIVNAIFDMDNQLDECMRDYTFIDDIEFDESLIQKFGNIVENVTGWMSSDKLKYYIVSEKQTNKVGTFICWGSQPYDFEYLYSGYVLIRDLNKGASRSRKEIQE